MSFLSTTRPARPRGPILPACLFGLALLLACSACGVKGSPKPPSSKNTFSWLYADATIRNDCLSIVAGLQGEFDNLDSVRLEVEPTGNLDDCEGCPFRPAETEVFNASDLVISPEGVLPLLYCPEQKSHLYRWRLIGVNTYPTLPNALTPVLIVEDPAGPLPWN